MIFFKYLVFTIFWVSLLYGLNIVIAGKLKRIKWQQAVLFAATVAMIGVFGEVLLDSVYGTVFGTPLWHYNILPVQHGYTSAYAPIIWGIYGFHLYLLHDTLKSKWSIYKSRYLALIFCIEALLFEALLTLSSLFWFGKLMYYYSPGDLWHISSFQNLPFYYVCGVVIIKAIKRFQHDPAFFTVMCLALSAVLIIFAR